MAALFCDSFDHYNTALITTKWASHTSGGASGTGTISAGTGRNGTDSYRIAYNGGGSAVGPELNGVTLPVSGTTAIVGVALQVGNLASASHLGVLSVYDGSTAQVSLRVNSDGSLTLLRGDINVGTVLASSSTSVSTGVYAYIELKVLIDPTVGTYEVRINGAAVIGPTTGANTRSSGVSQWTRIALGKSGGNVPGASSNFDFDDVYVCDGSGAQNNNFLGDGRCMMKLPNTGNGANADWTPSTGTDHGALVDENPPNTTDYNSSNTPGQRDTYLYPSLGVTGTVRFVQVCPYIAKSDAGARTVAPVHRISGVNYDGTAFSPGTTFAYQRTIYELSPATGVAWTVSEIDAAETGMKVVT